MNFLILCKMLSLVHDHDQKTVFYKEIHHVILRGKNTRIASGKTVNDNMILRPGEMKREERGIW